MMHWTEVNSSVDIQLGLLKFLSITPFISKGHKQKKLLCFHSAIFYLDALKAAKLGALHPFSYVTDSRRTNHVKSGNK